jgi:hypothetical protein
MSNTQDNNNGWQMEDEVVTTYRSIQLAQVQAEGRGIQQERDRVLGLLELLPFIWAGDTQMLTISRDALIDLVKDGASR